MEQATVPNFFGSYLKRLRTERSVSLRRFAAASRWEPSNYSRLERGLLRPPQSLEKLRVFRESLHLSEEDQEWRELVRLASLSRGELPAGVFTDPALLPLLPAFFRWVEEDKAALGELMQAVHTGDSTH